MEKSIKKIVVLLLTVVCTIGTFGKKQSASAAEKYGEGLGVFFYQELDCANQLSVLVKEEEGKMVSYLFKNDCLIEKSILDEKDRTVVTEIYDREEGIIREEEECEEVIKTNGYVCTILHKEKSQEVSNAKKYTIGRVVECGLTDDNRSNAVYNTLSKVEGTKLGKNTIRKLSVDNLEYSNKKTIDATYISTSQLEFKPGEAAHPYKLVAQGNECIFAPSLTGYIYRKLDVVDEGYTKHFEVEMGTPISVITSIVATFVEGPPQLIAIICGLIDFTVDNVVKYNQALEVKTYTYNETYKAVVEGVVIVETPNYNATYWQVHNEATGEIEYDLKQVNHAYPGTVNDLLEYAIGHYYNDYHSPNHVYTNACDEICDICGGGNRKTSHTYSYSCSPYCNSCGAYRTTTHSYKKECDSSCDVCGTKRATTHQYRYACSSFCMVCFEDREPQAHTYSDECDTTCNVCGSSRSVNHSYSYSCDIICDLCGDSSRWSSGHEYTNDCDTTCNNCDDYRITYHDYSNSCDTTCDVCGETREVLPHFYYDDCDLSCNVCGYYRGYQCTNTYTWKKVGEDGVCKKCIRKCTKCLASTVSAYDYSHEWTNSCDQYCDDCDYYRDNQCTYTYAWKDVKEEETCEKYVKTCTKCNQSELVSYDYTHAWTDSCDQYCNDCNYSRGNQCSYTYAWKSCSNSEECREYVKTCSKCGTSTGIAKDGIHRWTDSCDQYCDDCSYYRGNQCATFTYAWADVKATSTCEKYVKTCTKCKSSSILTYDYSHAYSNSTDKTCNDCGYVRK